MRNTFRLNRGWLFVPHIRQCIQNRSGQPQTSKRGFKLCHVNFASLQNGGQST
ncbi:hypothetical protein D083_3234 [Dickeya solani RNS 08.23.3.1.A]|nr:hypothetical protein D083_3234 [Dickeya solani RNS 08.23.3.1.A]